MCWITIKHSKPSELLEDGKKAFAYILECFSRAETNKPVRRYKIHESEILMEKLRSYWSFHSMELVSAMCRSILSNIDMVGGNMNIGYLEGIGLGERENYLII